MSNKWGINSEPQVDAVQRVLTRAAKDCQRRGFCAIAVVLVRAADGGVTAAMAGSPEGEERLREDAPEVLRSLIDRIGTAGVRKGSVDIRSDA